MGADRVASDPAVGGGCRLRERERAVRRGLLVAFRNLRLQLAAEIPDLRKTIRPLDCFERLLHCPDLQAHIGRSRAARLGNGEES